MTSADKDEAMYQLNLTDAEWEAWGEGADVDDILAARPRPSLAARIAEFFKGEPEAGLRSPVVVLRYLFDPGWCAVSW